MSTIVVEPTSTAQWQSLVVEAEARCHCQLDEDLESYLVFLLMRFAERPEMASAVMALDFLQSQAASGRLRQEGLRDVGDQCLLYSGFFPKRAERRRVKISYFVNLGRSAYFQLSETATETLARFYRGLADGFVPLMDVLQAVREMGSDTPILSPIEAMELWQDTGSRKALSTLQSTTTSSPVIDQPLSKH